MSSITINSNVGSVEVGTATKHREKIMLTLEKMMILLEQQHLVSLVLLTNEAEILIAGVEFGPDPVEGTENLHYSSAAISNYNVNTKLSKKVNCSDGKNSINFTFDMHEYHYANNNHSSQHSCHINMYNITT